MPALHPALPAALALALLAGCPKPAAPPQTTPPARAAPAGGFSPSFTLGGAVERPAAFTLDKLKGYPATTLPVTYTTARGEEQATFTGVPLWLLVNEAGVISRPGHKNDLIGKYLVATASDGYVAVIALGEILPDYQNQPIMVAYARDGAPLDRDGMARLVVPGDKAGGRHVRNLTHVEILDASP